MPTNKTLMKKTFADFRKIEKASSFLERYREIVSDPINILIKRVPDAGYIDDGNVILHNGHRVPVTGKLAYYDGFCDILVINRGVHEPLEEYCFQQMLLRISTESPKMIELGAYWAHYSMWLQKAFPNAICYMVEPKQENIECGQYNFKLNKYSGEFIKDFVGTSGFGLDRFIKEKGISLLNVLHSDIQGYEMEMLEGAKDFLSQHRAEYIFISTHSKILHTLAETKLKGFGYRIEVSSSYDEHTTSCDGFILASSPNIRPVFGSFSPLGRIEIANSSPEKLLKSIASPLN
jgi:hypothetical protein